MDFISVNIINPYGKRLIIATPLTEDDIQIIEDKWGLLDEDKNLGGFYKIDYEGWNAFLIIFNLAHKQSISYGMLSHEATHIVDNLFESIGHVTSFENNEPGAYLIEWIVNEIFKHFIERDLLKLLSYESYLKKL